MYLPNIFRVHLVSQYSRQANTDNDYIQQGSDKPGKNSVFCDTQGKPGKLREF